MGLPHLPPMTLDQNVAVLLSALLVSLALALIALLRNWKALTGPTDEGGGLGVAFENPSALLPHFVELRRRLIHALVGIAVGAFVGMAITQPLLLVLAEPIGGLEHLRAIHVTENMSVFFRVSVTAGIIIASPYVISQVWIFVAAGLKRGERRFFYLLFPFAMALFLTGVAFAYLVMLPVAVPFLTTFMGIATTPTLEDYVNFVTTVLLWSGISFELPMIVFVLTKVGLVDAGMLARNWRIAVILMATLAAIITPTPDPVNMGIVAAPLFALYLLSIILALFAGRKRSQEI
jgi:sec-independent protein translocase protein TatC